MKKRDKKLKEEDKLETLPVLETTEIKEEDSQKPEEVLFETAQQTVIEKEEETTVITEIVPVKPLEEVKIENSVFAPQVKDEEKPSVFVQETNLEKKEDKPVFSTKKENFLEYYKIVFLDNKKKREIYTNKLPSFTATELEIFKAFEKITLKEKILNKKLLQLDCKLELEAKKITISLSNGVLIKHCSKEQWMDVNHSTAEKIFNERVLKAYRDLTAKLPAINLPEEKTGLEEL